MPIRVLTAPPTVHPAPVDRPAPAAPQAVFVDGSGRRGRWLRRLGWVAGLMFTALAVASVLTIIGADAEAPAAPRPDTGVSAPAQPSGQNS